MFPAPAAAPDPQQEIAGLIRTLQATEQRLHELTGGEVDAVMHAGGRPYLLQEAQERLRESGEAQRDLAATQSAILNALPAHIALLESDGVIASVNDGWRHFARENALPSPAAGVGENYLAVCESAPEAAAGLRRVMTGEVPSFQLEYPCHSPAEQRWFRLMVTPLDRGQGRGAVVMHVNITERKLMELRLHRLNRLHTLLSKVSETVGRVRERQALFDQVCEIVVQDSGLRVAGVMLWEKRPQALRVASACGEAEAYLREITIATDGELGQGPAGAALRTGEHSVANDFHAESRMAPWRANADRYGLRSGAGFPLKCAGETIGVLVLHSGEAGYFQQDEIALMDSVAEAISFALQAQDEEQLRQRAEAALRASEANMAAAQQVAHFGSWEMELRDADDLLANPVRWSTEMYRLLGYDPATAPVTAQEFFSLLPEEDRKAAFAALEAAIRARQPIALAHRLVRPDGEERIVHQIAQIFADEEGRPPRIVGTMHDVTEQHRTQEAVDMQAHMLDHIGQAVIATDLGARILYANRFAGELHGWAPSEMIGRQLIEVAGTQITPEQVEQIMARLHQGESWTGELLVQNREGRVFPALVTDSPLLDRAGHLIGIIGIATDISARIEAEKALRESEERFRLLARATNDAIWDWNEATGEVWWSEGLELLFGYRAEEMEPGLESWSGRIHPDDAPRVREHFRDSINQGQETVSDEYRFRRKDGSYAHVLGRSQVIRDAERKPVRIIGGLTDMTERIEAERRIAEQAALIDKAQDSVTVRDLEHRLSYWNKSAERLYGWTAAEALGRSARELLYPDPAEFDDAMRKLLEQGDWAGELRLRAKDGREITVEARWTLLRDEHGQPRAVLTINTDATERKRLEHQVLRAQRMESLGTLAGGIAHDLNNALGPVITSLELLKMKFTDEGSQELLGIIETSAQRGADMVRQVLSFARGVEGRRTVVQIRYIVRELEKITNETFLKHVRVETRLPSNLWSVLGDPTQIHQVLLNLCVNARDAMPHGGALTISAENVTLDAHDAGLNLEAKPGPYVSVQVEDTGTGIPPALIEKIFDPFFTTKEVGKGTGLGLSTSQAIVKSHGGFMRVYSEFGKGAKFKVYLPAQTDPAEAERPEPKSVLPRGQGELILVIDDEDSVRQVTQRTLESYGYRVIAASDGAEATALFAARSAEIAAVLTDMMMPVMDGPATIHVLRKIKPGVPIAAASGLAVNSHVARAAELGVKHFLPKPYTAEALLKVLRELIAP